MPTNTRLLGDLFDFSSGKAMPPGPIGEYSIFGANGVIGSTTNVNAGAGTSVVGRVGSYCGSVHFSHAACWITDNAIAARPRPWVNARYAYYLLRSLHLNNHRIGSGQPLLTQSILNSVTTPDHDENSQHCIADMLGTLDDKIAVNERIAATYEKLLRLEFETLTLDSEPTGGAHLSLIDLVELNPKTPLPRDAEAPHLDMTAVPTSAARVQEWSRRSPKPGTRFRNGDTLMARITPCLENGKTTFIDFLGDDEVGTGSTEFIVLRPRSGVPAHLPYFLARSERFREHAIRNMAGSSGRQRVNAATLEDFPLSRPDSAAVRKFGESAAAAFRHMKSLDSESRDLRDLRDSLLPKLMSGEVRVREAEKLVEEAT